MKGCPFNSFGPCRKDECMFYAPADMEYSGCVILNHYVVSLLNSGKILDLTAALLHVKPELSPELPSAELKDFVESAISRLQKTRDLLKDVP